MSPRDPELSRDIELVDEIARRATGQVPPPASIPDPGESRPSPGEPVASAAAVRRGLDASRPFIEMGTVLPPATRLRGIKRILLALSRPVSSHQIQFNRGLHQAVEELVAAHEQTLASLRATLATAEVTIAEQQAEIDELRSDLAVTRGTLDELVRRARRSLTDEGPEPLTLELSRRLDRSHADLYRDLEATFRGTHDEIREQAEAYLDDVREACADAPLIDVGSGRGEWLELLKEHGIEAYGVDLNETFVEEAQARGLDVRHGDAVAHLRSLEEGSVGAITAFHLVEHLSLDVLISLIDAALRALAPGGVLLLETPNPTNVTVGAASFYLDPTHLKPLHPQFLEFLVTNRGFHQVEVRYVHESGHDPLPDWTGTEEAERSIAHLNWALFGPLDYAVIATKARAASPGAGEQAL